MCTYPNEASDNKTNDEIPAVFNNEKILFIIQNNQVIDIQGNGPVACERRESFRKVPALRNIAEVAIGCNDRAVITGNIL